MSRSISKRQSSRGRTSRWSQWLCRGVTVLAIAFATTGCAPEVGSPEWCEAQNEKPKGDWTANEATDYAKHCLF